MEYRQLGGSGLMVPVLSLGTGTFGGKGELFASWGETDVDEARRQQTAPSHRPVEGERHGDGEDQRHRRP